MKLKFPITILLMLFTIVSSAGEVNALVSSDKVGMEDYLTFSIEAKNYDGKVTFPTIDSFEGFDIVSGPSTNQSMSWVNGESTRSLSRSYTLVPQKTGTHTFPSFRVSDEEKTYKTKPITVTVVAGSVVPKTRNQRRSPFDDDLFNPRRPKPVQQGDVFVKTEIARKTYYQGEGFLINYRIYTQTGISDIGLKEAPVYQGFLSEDINSRSGMGSTQKVINGKRYDSAIIYRKILYPIHSGRIEIPALTFRLAVNNSRSFFSRGEVIERKSDKTTINVLPLPEPVPSDFSGGIGNFKLISGLDKQDVRIGDSIAYTITLKGQGNLSQTDSIVPETLEGFKIFKPSSPDMIVGENPLIVEKKWNIVLVPEKEGEISIPSLTFNYFDPQQKKYVKKTTPERKVQVSQGAPGSTISTISNSQEVLQISNDISYINTNQNLELFSDFSRHTIFKALTVFIPSFFLLAGLGLRITDPSRRNPEEFRKKRAHYLFRKKLKTASSHLKKGHSKEFYRTISTAAIEYFSNKWNQSTVDLHINEIGNILAEKNIHSSIIKSLINTVEYCDFESYTPSASGGNPQILKEMENIISDLESQL